MNRYPVLTGGTVAGLLGAAWTVVVANGAFDWMSQDGLNALNAFVALLVPIIAAVVAARYSTPVSAPNLPVGTVVNEHSSAPTGVVVARDDKG